MTPVDPFDLPEWLGEDDVTWAAESGLRTGYAVPGVLTGAGHEPLADAAPHAVPIAAQRDRLRDPVAVVRVEDRELHRRGVRAPDPQLAAAVDRSDPEIPERIGGRHAV